VWVKTPLYDFTCTSGSSDLCLNRLLPNSRRPYNLYCVGADVTPCSINQSIAKLILWSCDGFDCDFNTKHVTVNKGLLRYYYHGRKKDEARKLSVLCRLHTTSLTCAGRCPPLMPDGDSDPQHARTSSFLGRPRSSELAHSPSLPHLSGTDCRYTFVLSRRLTVLKSR